MTKYQKAKDAAGRVVLPRMRRIVCYPGTTVEVLTPREVEVLAALAGGLTVGQIATAEYISRKTVDGHLCQAYAKLGAHNRQSAVRRAVELGILPCPFCTPPPVSAAD